MTGVIEFNTFVWVLGNIIAFTVFIAALVFAVLYPILFDVNLTTAGRMIWRAILSVAGFGFLVVLGIFVDGRAEWFEFPDSVAWWRPLVRLIIYGFIGYTFTSLVVLLLVRRFKPGILKTAPTGVFEDTLNVRPRPLRRR